MLFLVIRVAADCLH